METTVIWAIGGLYRDNGKENGNYCNPKVGLEPTPKP